MTDEMRAAEGLVRALAPSGHAIPIPEPFAVDESHWLLLAVERGLVEFGPCPAECSGRAHGDEDRSDHFCTGDNDPHHLFAPMGTSTDGPMTLRRDHVPAIAAWTRAVVEFGHDPEHSALLGSHGRRLVHARFDAADGTPLLLIEARANRRAVRRLATALDACGSLRRLRAEFVADVEHVVAIRPAYLWVVGPSAIEPAAHVFRIEGDADPTFVRVASLPVSV